MKVKVKDIINIMNRLAPKKFAESWDNPGLQIGNPDREIETVLTALDVTVDVVKKAVEKKAGMIITHHPLLFKPLKCIDMTTEKGKIIELLISNNITAFAAHTNLDTAQNGVNDALVNILNLKKCTGMVPGYVHDIYKLVIETEEKNRNSMQKEFSFEKNSEVEKNLKNYVKFEICGNKEYILNLKEKISEKYENVNFECYEMKFSGKQEMMGRIGYFEHEMTGREALEYIKEKLKLPVMKFAGDVNKTVKCIGVLGGSGSGFAKYAQKGGADLYLTADLKYHDAQDIAGSGLLVADGGHFYTENVIVEPLAEILQKECNRLKYDVKIEAYKDGKDIFGYII